MRQAFLTAVTAVAIAFFATRASARFVIPTDAPVDRLVKNLESYIAEHPEDAQGYYNLARIHSLAFTLKAKSIRAYEGRTFPVPADEDMQVRRKPANPTGKDGNKAAADNPEELSSAELQRHVREAVRNYNKAIERDGKQGLFFLSFGSLLESAAKQSSECWFAPLNIQKGIDEEIKSAGVRMVQDIIKGKSDTREAERIIGTGNWGWAAHRYRSLIAALQDVQFTQDKPQRAEVRKLLDLHWTQATKDCYYEAFKLGYVKESQLKNLPISGLKALVSHEAAQSFLRVTKELSDHDKDRVAEVKTGLAALVKIPPSNAVTPIIFSISPSESVRQLASPRRAIAFDLDGTGRPQKWTWVKPDTGILVWDPSGSGQITSGRQLFGSVTWWMFWENGYRALDALDDTRDGKLSGNELIGLAAWFDRNSNGTSDPGEVRSIASLGISSISCRATTESDGVPANPSGLTLVDGSMLPTYDWIAVSARNTGPGLLVYRSLAVLVSAFVWMHRIRRREIKLDIDNCELVDGPHSRPISL